MTDDWCFETLGWLHAAAGRLEVALDELRRAGEISTPRRLESEPLIRLLPWVPFHEERVRRLRRELLDWDAGAERPSTNPTHFFRQHNGIHERLRASLIEMLDARLGDAPATGEASRLSAAVARLPDGIEKSLGGFLQDSLRAYRAFLAGDMESVLRIHAAAQFSWAYQDA